MMVQTEWGEGEKQKSEPLKQKTSSNSTQKPQGSQNENNKN
jgi:hypothetical protein